MEKPISEIDALRLEKAELTIALVQANLNTAQLQMHTARLEREAVLQKVISDYGIDIATDRIEVDRRVIICPDKRISKDEQKPALVRSQLP